MYLHLLKQLTHMGGKHCDVRMTMIPANNHHGLASLLAKLLHNTINITQQGSNIYTATYLCFKRC